MVTIIQGTTTKPASAERLVKFFTDRAEEYDGSLYIGYPIIGTAEGPYHIDALLVSRSKGLVVFNLVEGKNTANFREDQDHIYNKLESKLRVYNALMKRRDLQVPIYPVTFAPVPSKTSDEFDEEYPVCNETSLEAWLEESCKWDDHCSHCSRYESLLAAIQTVSTIRKGSKKRDIQKPGSRGARLKRLEDSIATLDPHQEKAVIETVEGLQRIRGLAGSGKTIVLALKAAYLHARHPDWKIAVTFHTRSLKGQFRQLINTFTIEQTNQEPDWDNIHIVHAWGAPGGEDHHGLYYGFYQANEVQNYYNYADAKRKFGLGNEFEGACQEALSQCSNPSRIYDAILVDEAQDLPPAFLQLCHGMLNSPQRLVYAYDELQSLNSRSLPPPEEIFGRSDDDTPKVSFAPDQTGQPTQDVVLRKCYRNSRPVLVTAHALGFGIYRKAPNANTGTGLVQMFDHESLWLDIGYEVTEGDLSDGHQVTLARPEESSPKFLEDHSSPDDLIQFHCFNSEDEQTQWITREIRSNLEDDELRHDDIVIIKPDPLSTRKVFGPIRAQLFACGINSHIAGVGTSPDVFFNTDHESITFTGVHCAKGNEAGMVYIINAHDCYSSGNPTRRRNQLFTAITRSKAWVRVLGFGEKMQLLIEEFDQVRKHGYSLRFRYPTEEQRTHLNIVHRDMTKDERSRLEKAKGGVEDLLHALDNEDIYLEDLDPEQVEHLRELLNGRAGQRADS